MDKDLAAALKACDNNQSELARRVKLTRQHIAYWVRKDKVPRWWRKAVVAAAKR